MKGALERILSPWILSGVTLMKVGKTFQNEETLLGADDCLFAAWFAGQRVGGWHHCLAYCTGFLSEGWAGICMDLVRDIYFNRRIRGVPSFTSVLSK